MPNLAYLLSSTGNETRWIHFIEEIYEYWGQHFTIRINTRESVAAISGLGTIPDNSNKIKILEDIIARLFENHPQIAIVAINTLERFYKLMETMILSHDFHPSHVRRVTGWWDSYAATIHLSISNEIGASA